MSLPARRRGSGDEEQASWLWLAPLYVAALAAAYFTGRFGGRWADSDSGSFSQWIRLLLDEGRLLSSTDVVYSNGYAFQVISAFAITIGGFDVGALQQVIFPFVAALVTLPAWLLYREVTGSARGATIASVLLLAQPEFLFVLLRGSHEKFTRAFMFMALYCLIRGFRLRDQPLLLAAHIGLFYLCAYAMIASNNLLANSFIAAMVLAGFLGWLMSRFWPQLRLQGNILVHRLLSVTLIALGLVYLSMFYIYEPAIHHLNVYQLFWQKISALFLDVEGKSTRPSVAYEYIASGWVNLGVYFVLSIANWIVLVASSLVWCRQGWRWLWRREQPASEGVWLLWLLYAAFAVQAVVSAIIDSTGVMSANLQLRLYPTISMLAVAMVALALARWRPRRPDPSRSLALGALVLCLAGLSMLKATNEPVFSNKWTFYRADEMMALEWSVGHLRDSELWTEYDERLIAAYRVGHRRPGEVRLMAAEAQPRMRDILLTDVTRLRSARLGKSLPPPSDALRVYDNGTAELYHLRPRTPYQR